jgi:DNA-binding protein YbaB
MGFFGDVQKARQMQQMMKEERATVTLNGITVRVNGGFEVEEISSTGGVTEASLSDVREAINRAFRDVQKTLATKLSKLA